MEIKMVLKDDTFASPNPPVPVRITVYPCDLLVQVLDATGQSCAEVYIEHQEGRVVAHIWDETADPNCDDPQSVVLLSSSNWER